MRNFVSKKDTKNTSRCLDEVFVDAYVDGRKSIRHACQAKQTHSGAVCRHCRASHNVALMGRDGRGEPRRTGGELDVAVGGAEDGEGTVHVDADPGPEVDGGAARGGGGREEEPMRNIPASNPNLHGRFVCPATTRHDS